MPPVSFLYLSDRVAAHWAQRLSALLQTHAPGLDEQQMLNCLSQAVAVYPLHGTSTWPALRQIHCWSAHMARQLREAGHEVTVAHVQEAWGFLMSEQNLKRLAEQDKKTKQRARLA